MSFSQSVTDTTPVKCFPIPVCKLIAKDLLSGDSAKALLKVTEEQLKQTELKVAFKDTVISIMKLKESNYESIIGMERTKYSILEDHTKKVELMLKKEKVKSKFKGIVSVGIIATLTYFLITK